MTPVKATILVVDDDKMIRDLLYSYLDYLGYKVLLAEDGTTALEILKEVRPDLVMTDVLMEPMNGIELLSRIKTLYPSLGVVVFTAFSSEDTVIKALRAGAADYIKKPFNLDQVGRVVQNVFQLRTAMGSRDLDLESLKREERLMVLEGNDPSRIPGVVNLLTMSAEKFVSQEKNRELSIALYEVIMNAIEHGNLEITAEEKGSYMDSGEYFGLLEDRRADPRMASRRVEIRSVLDETGIDFTIRDEGPGFDWRMCFQRAKGGVPSLSCHGRGLLLAEIYCDSIDFNESGNEVRLSVSAPKRGC